MTNAPPAPTPEPKASFTQRVRLAWMVFTGALELSMRPRGLSYQEALSRAAIAKEFPRLYPMIEWDNPLYTMSHAMEQMLQFQDRMMDEFWKLRDRVDAMEAQPSHDQLGKANPNG